MTSDIVAMPKGVAKDEQKVTRGIRYSTPRTKTQQIYDYIESNGPCSFHDIIEGLSKELKNAPTPRELGMRIAILERANMVERVDDRYRDTPGRSDCTWKIKEASQ